MSHDVMLHVLMLHDAHACDAMHVIVCRVRVSMPTIMLTLCIIIERDDVVACCVRLVLRVHMMQQRACVWLMCVSASASAMLLICEELQATGLPRLLCRVQCSHSRTTNHTVACDACACVSCGLWGAGPLVGGVPEGWGRWGTWDPGGGFDLGVCCWGWG